MHAKLTKRIALLSFLLAIASLTLAYHCEQRLGSAAIQVVDEKGQPLMGATISSGGMQGKTGNGGYLYSDGVPEGIHVVKAEFYGYAPSYHRLHVRQGASTLSVFHMLPIERHSLPYPSKKADIQTNGVRITIPADGADSSEGGQLEVATLLPGRTELNTMPGEFGGVTKAGDQVPLETLGALSMTITDRQGKEVSLRKPLTILVPYRGSAKEKDPVPLWSFDTKSGTWKEEGSGRIVKKGRDKFVEAQIPHLSWWNLDQPISNKTSVWVKSFVNEKGEPLFTPDLMGQGLDYSGISFPYSAYDKFDRNPMPVIAGACIDVKLGSRIQLGARFYGSKGTYEYEEKMQMPKKSSSCRTNPEEGVIIEKIQLRRVPSTCVRGRVAFKQATSAPFDVTVYMAPEAPADETDADPQREQETRQRTRQSEAGVDTKGDREPEKKNDTSSRLPNSVTRALLWDWNRPAARGETGSDGRFCVDHLPANRTFTFSFLQREQRRISWSPVRPLMAEGCGAWARIEKKIPAGEAFRCDTDYDRCFDLGDIDGDLGQPCRGG